jgi:hypothetical protein
MVSISSDLRLKKGVKIELYGRGLGNPPRGEMMEGIPVRLLRSKSSLTPLFQKGELLSSAKEGRGSFNSPIIYS